MTQEEKRLVKRAEYFYHVDQLRKTYTKRGRFEKDFVRGNSFESDDRANCYSDGGKGAAEIRDFGRLPDFIYLVRKAMSELNRDNLKVARALMKGIQPWEIPKKKRLSKRRVETILNFLKVHFAQCLQAYHEYLASPRGK